MNVRRVDPWAREQMSRSDAQRRYHNLILYQLRPMLVQSRRMTEQAQITVLKRLVREASRFKFESGVVAGPGSREEIVDLLGPWLHPEHPAPEEVKDWVKRAIRAFGASIDTEE